MANKKINQLVAKTTIQPTDLFPLGDGTTGQLFKKTIAELQAAIGGAVISVNGLVGTVVLDTDDIQELASPTNRYFTEARSRAAISLTVTGNSGASTYSNSTGVLNVPTYTLAGLGGITATFLSGASGIAYNSSTGVITYTGTVFTDASIRALVSAGAGLSYNSSTGVFSYSGTVYTDASIRALISLTTNGSSGASTYNNTTGVLNVPNYTLAGLGGISLASLSGSAPITYNSSTGAIGITQASGSTNGFLSSTDWNTFNGKQSALTLGNVSEVVSNVLMFPDGQNGKTIGNLSIQVVQAGSTTNGFLSSANWNTFNNKQNAITLTTTGTSGAATFSGGTLNIPQYQAVLTNPVTGTGTTNFVTKWTSSSAIGNSLIFDNGAVGINTSSPNSSTVLTLQESASLSGAISFLNRNSTQRYSIAVDAAAVDDKFLAFIDNNTAAVRLAISPAGNVGIGTTSPNTQLQVNGNPSNDWGNLTLQDTRTQAINQGGVIAFAGFKTGTSSEAIFAQIKGNKENSTAGNEAGYLSFLTNNNTTYVERMRITSGGNVGIGTASPVYSLHVVGTGLFRATGNAGRIECEDTNGGGVNITVNPSFSGTGTPAIQIQTNHPLIFATNNTDRGRITAGGNFLFGTSSDNGERLYVSGSIRATGSITANSDARLKKNIERIENALEKVGQISGYTYNTIYDEDRHAGVIAQEIDKVLPEIVNKGNDGLMGVEYGNISALLIEAIKDLKKDNESLQARLTALEK